MRPRKDQYPSYFDVLTAAKYRDKTAIGCYRNLNCLNVFLKRRKYFLWSPVTQLAWRNKRKSCNFLLKYGANIEGAIYGAALGGHDQYAHQLLKKYQECPKKKDLINYEILGVAQRGDCKRVAQLLEQGVDSRYAILGLAFRGDFDAVEELLSHNKCWLETGSITVSVY